MHTSSTLAEAQRPAAVMVPQAIGRFALFDFVALPSVASARDVASSSTGVHPTSNEATTSAVAATSVLESTARSVHASFRSKGAETRGIPRPLGVAKPRSVSPELRRRSLG